MLRLAQAYYNSADYKGKVPGPQRFADRQRLRANRDKRIVASGGWGPTRTATGSPRAAADCDPLYGTVPASGLFKGTCRALQGAGPWALAGGRSRAARKFRKLPLARQNEAECVALGGDGIIEGPYGTSCRVATGNGVKAQRRKQALRGGISPGGRFYPASPAAEFKGAASPVSPSALIPAGRAAGAESPYDWSYEESPRRMSRGSPRSSRSAWY